HPRPPRHQPLGLRRRQDAGEDDGRAARKVAPPLLGRDQRPARAVRQARLHRLPPEMLHLPGAGHVPAGRRHVAPLTPGRPARFRWVRCTGRGFVAGGVGRNPCNPFSGSVTLRAGRPRSNETVVLTVPLTIRRGRRCRRSPNPSYNCCNRKGLGDRPAQFPCGTVFAHVHYCQADQRTYFPSWTRNACRNVRLGAHKHRPRGHGPIGGPTCERSFRKELTRWHKKKLLASIWGRRTPSSRSWKATRSRSSPTRKATASPRPSSPSPTRATASSATRP